MTWWAWVLVFVGIALLCAYILFRLGRRLWRSFTAFLGETDTLLSALDETAEQAEQVRRNLTALDEAANAGGPAIFRTRRDLQREFNERERQMAARVSDGVPDADAAYGAVGVPDGFAPSKRHD